MGTGIAMQNVKRLYLKNSIIIIIEINKKKERSDQNTFKLKNHFKENSHNERMSICATGEIANGKQERKPAEWTQLLLVDPKG